ncbi:hypothetical protein PhaeoP75_03182 [Phaeobacter gallaeciensis]|uniref:Uncharacterized protein n=2 Tax=Phaeobacter gallaeciensis TaxID=60890 RepID=A0AAC9ZB50_9RHOB|nr:hypothetical protein Gal_03145 [Phaeobacter gallaeciensis DSM 26640]ATE94136.1 hypothetical protein PhaeoP11_03133 [Phaeobacter gallaeciensis]ATE96043.1 hypothetical protein PhaeoP73_00714 [Phaeobacter gallaeciensis]ATF02800.1 hypothetical protein PhaeoP75_03182 [Phaeobacter gallaeciensis]ATF07180.1 hypothetical protein PhaeoP63_03131 [Phaeobacter gallaeciensis]
MEFDELELDPEEFGGFFFPCVDWLVSEGVIRVQDIRRYTDSNHSGFPDRPVLTSYGFQLLEQKISVGADAERLANRVKEVSSNGVGYANVGDLIGGILGGFTKSIGS